MFLAALLLAANLSFPIFELGDCNTLSSCKTYCEVPWHQTVCTDYGVSQGVLERPQVLAAVAIDYPIPELGNCGSKTVCKAYCDTSANRSACVDFARAHGIDISVAASGGQAPSERPGGGDLTGLEFPIAALGNCGSVQACKTYCDQRANRQACFDFAYDNGLVGGQSGAEKLSGLKFPIAELGNCGSMAECDAYCSQPDHHEQCDAYAKAHGFESSGGGKIDGPGGCITSEECTAYCNNPAHREECDASWQKHCGQNPDKPECEKPPGGGTGGCTSDEECRNFCKNNPDDESCRRGREEWCQKNPDDCQERIGPKGCIGEDECRLYCQQNPNDPDCQRGHDEWCQKNPEECQRSQEDSNQCGGQDCGQFCVENPNDPYCLGKDGDYCQQNPDKCHDPFDDGPVEGPVEGPGEGSSPCGGMDCGQFCAQNPDDEYCVGKDAEFCKNYPEECGPPEGKYEGLPEGEAGPPQ